MLDLLGIPVLVGAVDLGTVSITVALVSGIGGALVAIYKVGPERTNVIVTYQTEVLDNLRNENLRLLGVNAELNIRVEELERRAEEHEAKAQEEERRRVDLERRLALLEESGIEWDAEMGTRKEDRESS